ncbi:MAG TPA: HepT-like ribonuclease domain-containing protein [Edaphobacter sp.]
MPFRNVQTHFKDILQSIDHIGEFIAGIDFEGYQEDRKTRSAVERELQIITEAATRLGEEAETFVPGPDWKGFRGMGNILRHVYHRVNDEIVWNTVKEELPPMRIAVSNALRSMADSDLDRLDPASE